MHPSPDQLIAYDSGELSEQDAIRLREHLAVCPDCARTVLDLAAFPKLEAGPGVEPLSSEATESQWRRVLERIEREDSGQGTSRKSPRWPSIHLLAAVLAIACVALGFWVLRLEREGPGEKRPTANIFVAELLPIGAPVARGEQSVRVPTGMGSVVFLLAVADLRSFDDYRVTLRRDSSEGEVVWDKGGLVRGPQGNFSINLPRGSLPAGRYRLLLEGQTGEGRETLARYELRVEYEG